MCRRRVKPFQGIPTSPTSGARDTRDHACPAAPAGPGRHPGHPIAVEGLPVSGPGPMTTRAGEPAPWALTIVTVPVSFGAARAAVKKFAYAVSPGGHAWRSRVEITVGPAFRGEAHRSGPVSWTAVSARWTISLVSQYQGEVPLARASDADRDHVLELLRTAAVEGRLSHETFLFRMERVLVARDLAQLRSTIADLPGAGAAPPPAAPASPSGLRRFLRRASAAPTHLALRIRRRHRIRHLPVLALPPAGTRSLVIGRASSSHLRLSHESVSRSHAVLTAAVDGWSLCDLSSLNGTRVNGRRLTGQTPVRPGDWVTFGRMHFRLAAP